METFNCVPNITKSKIRPHLTGNFYHNVSRGIRPIGNDYAIQNCTGRRSTSSLTLTYPWQERPPPTPVSCVGIEYKSSKGKLCSIALAVASFVVLVAVLAIAGLALYMGVLHTETPNVPLTFSCSAKIVKGDRFIGALQEKARRYKRSFEAMYQRSVLGHAFVSCIIEKFGNDTLTVYFKLLFNRLKITKNVPNIEKVIRDILITDAISRHPIFKNIRFDPRHITVKQVLLNNDAIQNINPSSSLIIPSNHSSKVSSKNVILKSINKTSPVLTIPTKKPLVEETDIPKEDVLPVVQGSFKISKTDADITEKKTDHSTSKPKQTEKTTQAYTKKGIFRDSSVTSALYKIAAVEKVTKNEDVEIYSSTKPTTSTTSTTTKKLTTIFTTPRITTITTTEQSTKPVFLINPFDEAPWVPILPNASPDKQFKPVLNNHYYLNPTIPTPTGDHPIYTSFVNPGLSYNFKEAELLGTTSLKSHPIPVNKIPMTQSVSYPTQNQHDHITNLPDTSTKPFKEKLMESSTPKLDHVGSEFVEIETFKYVPNKKTEENLENRDQLLRNISSIFHTLTSSLDTSNLSISLADLSSSTVKPKDEPVSGQGQVEVVDNEDEFIQQTTKHSLVTLLPVKSNSGIGRPIRKRPYHSSVEANASLENRSFPTSSFFTNVVNSTKNINEDFKVMGILNFATEESVDLLRYPKMDETTANYSKLKQPSGQLNNSSHATETNISNTLTAEEIKQLAEISKITNNVSIFQPETLISNKAVSASFSNLNGLPVLTKSLNKINVSSSDNSSKENASDCTNASVFCGDGTCLPETAKCNQLIDCNDGADEDNCNCADYLKSQYLLGKICDGVVDCWDYSDENHCEWCRPDQYVCSNSKVCINKNKICDGFKDCPQGDDERQCVTISSDVESADKFPYYSGGYLMVRKYGKWGKLCIDNFELVVNSTHIAWQIPDLGQAVCKSMTYQSMSSIRTVIENQSDKNTSEYFELALSIQNEKKSSLSFKKSNCTDKKIIKVECQSLECGARPQVVKHIARVVGGGNAGLGSWPWQAALYKEGEFQCGATLLSDQWLVSAGHCFYHSQDEYWVARLGALRRGTSMPSPYEQLQPVVKIIVHPGYIDSGFINDISLLKLKSPVIFSDYVRPVCLPQPNQVPTDGKLCTVVGWGQLFEVGRIFPDTLQEVQVPVISTLECRKRTLFLSLYRITEDMFCAGYERGGRDACLGDSGGPLMCLESNGRWILQGVTSNGYGCARANRPGIYTKVANYVDWIKFIINNDQVNAENEVLKDPCTGHRCPLGECLPESRLCNGFIECSDGSDEKNCTTEKTEPL